MINHRFKHLWMVATLLLFCGQVTVSHADFLIDIKDVTISAKSSGSIDITIVRTNIGPAPENISAVSYSLQIVPIAEVGGVLQFSSAQISDETLDNYVFGSASSFFGANVLDASKRQLVGGDGLLNAQGDPVEIDIGTTQRLLARIEFSHLTDSPLASSGTYEVRLIADPVTTVILNAAGDELAIDARSYSNVGTGLITIVPAAVPEPTTAVLFGISGCLLYARRRGIRFVRGRDQF